jgi:biopolymer transport protein ExbD
MVGEIGPMLDVVFVLLTVIFFVVSLGYVAGCDRLK